VEATPNGVTLSFSGGDGGRSTVMSVECADVARPRVVRWSHGTTPNTYTVQVRARAGCALDCARNAEGAVCGGAARGACIAVFDGKPAQCKCSAGHSGTLCADRLRLIRQDEKNEYSQILRSVFLLACVPIMIVLVFLAKDTGLGHCGLLSIVFSLVLSLVLYFFSINRFEGWFATDFGVKPSLQNHLQVSFDSCLYDSINAGFPLGTGPPRTYSVFSVDTEDVKYFAIAPLTAYIWAHAHNITSIVFLAISKGQTIRNLTAAQRLVALHLLNAGAIVWLLGNDERDRVASTLQIVRLAAWALPFVRPEDLIITCDTDIWPLSTSFWAPILQPANRTKLFIFNGDFYLSQRQAGSCDNVALSEMAMQRSSWSEMHFAWRTAEASLSSARACSAVAEDTFRNVHAYLMQAARKGYSEEVWAANLASKEKHNRLWSADQFLSSEMVQESLWCPDRCTLNRDIRRLHHGAEYNGMIESWTDGHMEALSDAGILESVLPIWNDLLGPGHGAFPRKFHNLAMDLAGGRLPSNYGEDFFHEKNVINLICRVHNTHLL
jgi:hypothetical protein